MSCLCLHKKPFNFYKYNKIGVLNNLRKTSKHDFKLGASEHVQETTDISKIHQSALILWDYLNLSPSDDKYSNDNLIEAGRYDVMIVLGNHDVRTATYAGQLYLNGAARLFLITGKSGSLTEGKWREPEAHVFRDAAARVGVPSADILVEPEARNSGENVLYSHRLLTSLGHSVSSVLLVHTPYMQRRALATWRRQWPSSNNDLRLAVTAAPLTLDEFIKGGDAVTSYDELYPILTATMRRLIHYPSLGYQIEQYVPTDVIRAYETLQQHNSYCNSLKTI